MLLTGLPDSCSGCPLSTNPHCGKFTKVTGTGTSGVLIVAEASGEVEAIEGRPLVEWAPSGSLIEKAIRMSNLSRNDFLITNCLRCRPPRNHLEGASYEREALDYCLKNLDKVIDEYQPRAILALGSIAVRELTGFSGRKRSISYIRGYCLPGPRGIPTIGSYHPAFLSRGNTRLLGLLVKDLATARSAAAGRITYVVDPSTEMTAFEGIKAFEDLYNQLLSDPEVWVAYDIETKESLEGEEHELVEFEHTNADVGAHIDLDEGDDGGLGLREDVDRLREETGNEGRTGSGNKLGILSGSITSIQFAISDKWGVYGDWGDPRIRALGQKILALPNPKVGHNCFHENTSVWMSDASWKKITKIQPGDEVFSRDEEGNLVIRKVLDAGYNLDDRPWIEVKVDGAYNRGVGKWGNSGVVCTPDHEWILLDGSRVKAENLRSGDKIFLPRKGSDDLIHGSLLGDGSADRKNRITISHMNKEWAQAKAGNLGVELRSYKQKEGYSPGSFIHIVSCQIPKSWRDNFYQEDGVRTWNTPSDKALAIWYGDDGTLASKSKRNQTVRISLHKYGNDKYQTWKVLRWACNEFGKSSLQKQGNGYNLSLSVAASKVFFSRIATLLHPSMSYKLPEDYQGLYNGWMEDPSPLTGEVILVTPKNVREKGSRRKWCITVEDTHLFFTRGGLVANSDHFDRPVLERDGIYIEGDHYDSLSMRRALQPDLPAGLQQVAVDYGWCLNYRQRIVTWDGQKIPIGEVVEKRLPLILRGMDNDGKLIPVSVINWHKTDVDKQDWIKIKVDGARQPIYCTPDHEVWANGSWVEASSVKPGDIIPLPKTGPTDLIHGMLLGDSHIAEDGSFVIVHGPKQEEYVKAKAHALGIKLDWRNNGEHISITGSDTLPRFWRKKFYPEEARIFIPPPSDRALAIWYMDDGHWKKFTNRSSGDGTVSIAIHKSCDEKLELEWLKKRFGDNVRLTRSGDTFQIYLGKESRDLFYETVASYIHPSMEYKLPPKYHGRYNGWLEELIPREGIVTEAGIVVRRKNLTPINTRYCVTVDHPTHRFFTEGGLVSNCWPWKHYSGSNAILYGVADVCSLVRIVSKLPEELDRLGMWDGYQKYIREFRDKVEIPWERRGIPISVERLDEFREYLTREIVVKTLEVKAHIPDELHSSHPKEGYKDIPDRIKEIVITDPDVEILFNPTTKILKNGKVKLIKSKIKISDIYKMLVNMELPSLLNKVLKEYPELALGDFGGSWRLFERIWFNPRSSQQMIKYLKFKGYEVPKTFKDGKETTSDKLMKRLEAQTKDPVIKLSREIRAFEKMRNSYTGQVSDEGIAAGGWIPSRDGRLHPTILVKSTWQMASLNPNVMTMPVRRGDLAEGFRRCVKAEDGHTLLEADFKSFHAKMTGREAKDSSYMRLSSLDIHSYVTGFMVKWPKIETALSLPDEDLKQFLAEIKSKYKDVRNLQAKPAILGIGFGMSSRRLYFENEEYFRDEKEAKKLLDLIKRIFPRVFKWQENILEEADRRKYIQSVWGARRWFWDITSWKKNKYNQWYKTKGADAEKAIAYLPSNHSHGMLRNKLLELESLGLLEKYELVNVVHDALLFHVFDELLDEAATTVKDILERPVIELADLDVCPNGFVCEVEVSAGPDWAKGSMKEMII